MGALIAASAFVFGTSMAFAAPQVSFTADRAQFVMLDDDDDEDVELVVDEPVESGDILVDEDGGVWEVQ